MAYARIDREGLSYTHYQGERLTFDYNAEATLLVTNVTDKGELWFNIAYPRYQATLYCTYLPIDAQRLGGAIEDSYQLAYGHARQAEGIRQNSFSNIQNNTSGIVYDIGGDVATPLQFFATDSISNFLRASLYYDNPVNADSVAPITNFLREDIHKLIETLQWRNRK